MNFVRSLLITIVGLGASCTTRQDPKPRFDPTVGMYDSVVSDIKRLSGIGKKESWISSGASHFSIESEADLERALRFFGDSRIPEENEARKNRLSHKLRTSVFSDFFGFDGDFSVITFFDSTGRQTYIYPEAMSPKTKNAEQAGTGQPTTRSLSDSEGSYKPQPDSEGRSR